MKYLILGGGGMAGHLLTHYLLEKGEDVEAIARRKLSFCKTYIFDVKEIDELKKIIFNNKYDYIINCIGILNTDADKNKSEAIYLNSFLPHLLVDLCERIPTKIIQISTDCVFSGDRGQYNETDIPDAHSFYGRTKALGEIFDTKNITLRTSIIGPDMNENGIGLFNWFMKQKGEIYGYSKVYWSGVTTLMLARIIHTITYKKNVFGLFNIGVKNGISKYDLLLKFKKYANKDIIIKESDIYECNKTLVSTVNLDYFNIYDYDKQLDEMLKWIMHHEYLYKHYFL